MAAVKAVSREDLERNYDRTYLTIERDEDGIVQMFRHENIKDAMERRLSASVRGEDCAVFLLLKL